MTVKRICCIGAGYVGGPTCAVIASRCPHLVVTIVDVNPLKIEQWNSDFLPIYEPGLLELVTSVRGKNLFFSTDIDTAIKNADLIFVSVNTPTKANGIGAADLKHIELATRRIADIASGSKIIVEKSTVPCKTAHAMRLILDANAKSGSHFDIISNPEFLAEGSAIEDLTNPDRVLIGSLETPSGKQAAECLAAIYRNWVPNGKILKTNLWSSELSKLAANALLAQRISSINALSSICEATGANVAEVARACGLDSRIGPEFLNTSLGFGGSCFQKDILNLMYLSESLHLHQVSSYWKQIVLLNEYQKQRFIDRVIKGCLNTIWGKRIAVWGFAFKKNTGDTRQSPAITVVQGFLKEGANVVIYDPKVPESQIWQDLKEQSISPFDENSSPSLPNPLHLVKIEKSAVDAAFGADAIVICTEWDEFKPENCNYELIYTNCRKPASIYDGRGVIKLEDEDRLKKLGWKVEVVGRSSCSNESLS